MGRNKKGKKVPGGWAKIQTYPREEWARAHNLRTELLAAGWQVRLRYLPKNRVAVFARREDK